jgi:arginine/lysine/ornithine decarboxylase
MTTPIVDFVRAYQQAEFSRLHMPGHKGTPLLGCEPWDITEIAGADELYAAEGILAESEANATALFGTQHTYYATEGSSQCIRAMLYLALQAAPAAQKQGNARPLVLAARNAHKAFVYACALLDVDAAWLWPEQASDTAQAASLCSCPVSPRQLRRALETLAQQGRKPFAVYLTSPDYLGGMQDVAALAAVCREADVPLLVDNAHGAYLPFLPASRRTGKVAHPIALGAAMCCDSGHKTLPVLTGGAYLQIGPNAPLSAQEEAAVRGALCLFGSTSPSYLILQSLDRCNRYLAEGGRQGYAACAARVEALRAQINACAGAVLARPTDEPLKLVLDGAALAMTGQALADRLRRHKVECEYADGRFVVLMFTPENPERDDARVLDAVRQAAREATSGTPPAAQAEAAAFAALAAAMQAAAPRCTIRQAVFARQESIPVERALGRVCALPTVACPPAIPIAVSGEEIGAAALELFRRYGIRSVAVVQEPTDLL